MSNLFNSLKILNLTINQSKIYLALIKSFELTAQELHQKTLIPRSKVYSALEYLVDKNFILKKQGRPLKFEAIDYKTILKREKEEIENKFNLLDTELSYLWELRNIPQSQQVSMFVGNHEIIKKTISMIEVAKLSILFHIGFLIDNENQNLIAKLIEKSDINKKISFNPGLLSQFDKNDQNLIKQNFIIKELNMPPRALIIDQEHIMVCFQSINKKNNIQFVQGIEIKSPEFAKLMQQSIGMASETGVRS